MRLDAVAARLHFSLMHTSRWRWGERRRLGAQYREVLLQLAIQEEVNKMALVKHGHGEVLPESEQEQKTASQNWTDKDRAELAQENADGDE